MCPTLETSVDCPSCLTLVCNTETARWRLCCTPPSYYLEEAALQRTRKRAESPAQDDLWHWPIDTGLAKLLTKMCIDWSSWRRKAGQQTRTKGLSKLNRPSTGKGERNKKHKHVCWFEFLLLFLSQHHRIIETFSLLVTQVRNKTTDLNTVHLNHKARFHTGYTFFLCFLLLLGTNNRLIAN